MNITENEAKAILEASIECYRRQNKVPYEEQCHEDCDNCNLCYAQGTAREQLEAFSIAIKTLEKQEKIKEAFEKWENDTSGIYGEDDETIHLIVTLKKILRSDEE